MEKKTETKLQTRFSVSGKTCEAGRTRRDVHDGLNTPPPISI